MVPAGYTEEEVERAAIRSASTTREAAPEEAWRCFFCGDTFTTQVDARNHFGTDQMAQTACQIKAAGEFALLQALRNAEDDLARYRAEDSDILRAMYSAAADHGTALKREEEKGYARGLRDANYADTREAALREALLQAKGALLVNMSRIRLCGPGAELDEARAAFPVIDAALALISQPAPQPSREAFGAMREALRPFAGYWERVRTQYREIRNDQDGWVDKMPGEWPASREEDFTVQNFRDACAALALADKPEKETGP